MDRIDQLRRFVAAQPDDPFPRYALALERKGQGDLPGAAAELEALLARKPDYLAAYLQLGMFLQQLDRLDEARSALRRGQECAQRQGNQHALSELTSTLEGLGETEST